LLEKRRKLRAAMDAAPPLEGERQKNEKLIVDGEKQLETITETHRQKMSPLYSRRFEINQVRKLASQAKDDLRSTCEDRELLVKFAALNEELIEFTNERAKLQTDITQMQIWKESDIHESAKTPSSTEVNRYNERVQDYGTSIERMEEKIPALDARIDELNKQLNQLKLLES